MPRPLRGQLQRLRRLRGGGAHRRRGVALARRAGQAFRWARCAVDALRDADGGVLHADAGQDHQGPEGPGRVLMAGKTTRVVMPQLGASVHEGTVSRWRGKPGDATRTTEEAPVPSPPRGEGEGEGLKQEPHRYSPGVQMAASDLKVDLSKVTGTGLGGRVTKKDVQDFAAKAKAAPAAPASQPATPAASGEGDEVVQLTRVRRLIDENRN